MLFYHDNANINLGKIRFNTISFIQKNLEGKNALKTVKSAKKIHKLMSYSQNQSLNYLNAHFYWFRLFYWY